MGRKMVGRAGGEVVGRTGRKMVGRTGRKMVGRTGRRRIKAKIRERVLGKVTVVEARGLGMRYPGFLADMVKDSMFWGGGELVRRVKTVYVTVRGESNEVSHQDRKSRASIQVRITLSLNKFGYRKG